MTEREKKAEIFRSQYPERYTGGANTEVHPMISDRIHNYNKNFYKLRIRNVCKLSGVKVYQLLSVNVFDGENGQLRMCNMFKLKQSSNKLCKMAQLLLTDMDQEYLKKPVKILGTGVSAVVTKPEGGKMG